MTDADPTEILSIDLITRHPAIHNGRPVIRGTTLEVVDVVSMKLQNRLDSEALSVWFQVGIAEIHAALAYYYLHKETIDALIEIRHRVGAEVQGESVDEDVPSDEEIHQLLTDLGNNPLSGKEMVEQGLVGGWEDKGITDSVAWLEEHRRKRREKFK